MKKPKVIVCPSPLFLKTLPVKGSIVVVIDILRATTSMCVAFGYGASEIIPVKTIEECKAYKDKGYLIAGERDGKKIEGFDMGNSPFSFMGEHIRNAKIAMTTTNGTKCIHASKHAHQIIIGSFVNMSSVINYLKNQQRDVILLASGWKDKMNLEDTAFGGAVALELENDFIPAEDSTRIAMTLYEAMLKDKRFFIKNATQYEQIVGLNIVEDVKYCLRRDLHHVLPIYQNGKLIDLIPNYI
jgi:2-phosphosulfolactate phosphatase